jgi:hypothetical protein
MRVGYLLSNYFPYASLLCADAGPAIAYEYDWTPCTIATAAIGNFDCLVIDNRHHTHQDIINLVSFLDSRRVSPVFLRVNDPSIFHKNDRWYRFCVEQTDRPGIHFLTPYEPTGLLSHWLSISQRTNFVYAPFTYDTTAELPIAHADRRRLVAVSGRQRRDLYPRRFLVQQASKLPASNFLLKLHLLRHPGYPEKIDKSSHAISGSAFIQWLSHHRSAFIDSSIYRVELLKYREAAYAGCAPFGDLPWSLHECPDDAFYQFQSFFDLIKFRAVINDSQASEAVATAFRRFMRFTRCRTTWRRIVASSLARLI